MTPFQKLFSKTPVPVPVLDPSRGPILPDGDPLADPYDRIKVKFTSASTGATWQLQRPLVVWSDGMYWDGLVGIALKKAYFYWDM